MFYFIKFSPIDPIKAYIGSDLLNVPPEQYPLIAARWELTNLYGCDFGFGLAKLFKVWLFMLYNMPVIDVIRERAGPSFILLFSQRGYFQVLLAL